MPNYVHWNGKMLQQNIVQNMLSLCHSTHLMSLVSFYTPWKHQKISISSGLKWIKANVPIIENYVLKNSLRNKNKC